MLIYTQSYNHGVISNLIARPLLCAVREEIRSSLHFTPKETDIYKIHQSGDLANLDGLDDDALAQLPSLLELRNALYSNTFRTYLSKIAGCESLSGEKTDMAINIYTPGCHLLCHDDVIGSRRLSYILYLSDPEAAWQEEWGGALRLYPTSTVTDAEGKSIKTPSPDFSVSIPPAFNQLSFFAVRPGESFHDVEEVYASREAQDEKQSDEQRVRMAISGWYHIPQEGEDGYQAGLQKKITEQSSLVQLQGEGTTFDLPRPDVSSYGEKLAESGKATATDDEVEDLSETDLDHLLKFIAPTYLTPDTLEELSNIFSEESSLTLDDFLSQKFSTRLRDFVEREEARSLPESATGIEQSTTWRVARPPFKHRYLYQQPSRTPSVVPNRMKSPIQEIIEDLLPSSSFRKWLTLATSVRLKSNNILARRFRRGHDYSLATPLENADDQLELTLGMTPSDGWVPEHADEDDSNNGTEKPRGDVGGYEVYLAGEDEDDSKQKSDPAVYSAKNKDGEDDDDGELFSSPAAWNTMTVVLRDKGVLKFVKYVSKQAKGDRWDCIGEYGVVPEDDTATEGSTSHESR